VLPWDFIEGAPGHDFLWNEWEKAARGELTGDCRWDGCKACGACAEPPGNVLAVAGRPAPLAGSGLAEAPSAPSATASEPLRYLAVFSVTGKGRFLGHLDRMEAFRRAVRRAGGRLALSAGMRPKALLALCLPLGVGVQGLRELCEFELADEPEDGFAERLAAALPGHMRVLGLDRYHGRRRVAARVVGARYRLVLTGGVEPPGGDSGLAEGLAAGARRFAEATEWMVEEAREGRARSVDVKRYVERVDVVRGDDGEWCAEFTAAVNPLGTARPDTVLRALEQACGFPLSASETLRLEIVLAGD
jgi:radical SAM-linked protein